VALVTFNSKRNIEFQLRKVEIVLFVILCQSYVLGEHQLYFENWFATVRQMHHRNIK